MPSSFITLTGFKEVKDTAMNTALFQGRFQPPTIAHFCTIETILKKWESLIICVIYNSPKPEWFDPKWNAYLGEAEMTSYAPGKNPFAPQEVKKMWDACIAFHKIEQHVSCHISKRPYFDKDFNTKYPPSEFTIVRPMLNKRNAKIDYLRGKIFPELLNRKYEYVYPPFELHNTEIVKKVLKEGASWKTFIAPGAYDIFQRINGPARIKAAYSAKEE